MIEPFQPAFADYLRDESRRTGSADRIAFPRSEADVLAALAAARAARMPVTTQGARTGITAEKDREETELEDAAHVLGQALALWFAANNREDEAAQVDFPISSWRQLRDQRLLTRSQLVIDLAAALAQPSGA